MFRIIGKWAIVIVALVLSIMWLGMTGGRQGLGGFLDSPVVAAAGASLVVATGWFVTARLQS